jgi:hypothetical protein
LAGSIIGVSNAPIWSTVLNQLRPNIFEFIGGVNEFDTGRIMASFADDAVVSDNHREVRGDPMIIGCVAW